MCEFVGGAYIYAECVKIGIGKLVWDSHPIQETNMGNFIFLSDGYVPVGTLSPQVFFSGSTQGQGLGLRGSSSRAF